MKLCHLKLGTKPFFTDEKTENPSCSGNIVRDFHSVFKKQKKTKGPQLQYTILALSAYETPTPANIES